MRTGILAVAIVVVITLALLAAVETVPISVSCSTQGTVLVEQATSVASTMTTTVAQTARGTNQTVRVYNFNPRVVYQPTLTTMPGAYVNSATITITPNQYVYQNVALTAGMDVQVWWIANNTVDAYVFNSSENAQYATSNATKTLPNIASSPASKEGTISFRVPVNDVYFLAFFNPHNGSFGLAPHSVGLYNATGIATFQATSKTLITKTTTVLVPQQVTSTQTTTGSYRRTVNFVSQVGGTACSG